MEVFLEVFNEAQLESCMHDVLSKQLKKFTAEGSSKEKKAKWDFFKRGCIDRILIYPKNHANVDKLIKFISGFIATLSDKDMKNVCLHFSTRLQSGNKIVRQRCCDIIGEVLANVFENNGEVCCDLLDDLTKFLTLRIFDKTPTVRVAAVQALRLLQNIEDPNDVVNNEICKAMTLDSSFTVRIAAIEAVYLTEHSLTKLLYRVRDVKSDVRIAAIKKIATLPINKLASNARASLVRHGLTDRDAKVRVAAQNLIQTWLESTNYNVTILLRAINPLAYEEETLLLGAFIAQGAASNDEPTSVGTHIKDWSLDAAMSVTFLYDIMWTFIRCIHARSLREVLVASEICDTYLPDSVLLCRLIDQLVAINGVMQCQKKNMVLKYLIKTSALVDPADIGGINQLLSLFVSILSRNTLPYELVEVTLKAHADLSAHLQATNDFFPDEYTDKLLQLAEDIRSHTDDSKAGSEEDDGAYSATERSLQVLHFVLKNCTSKRTSSNDSKWIAKAEKVLPFLMSALQQLDVNIRCISVSCIGLLCLISQTLSEMYRPIILQVAGGGFEENMVVCVAVQSLSDICMVHRDHERARCSDYEICNLLTRLLGDSEPELVRIASESAAKLLFGGCIRDSSLLASLLKFFFISDYLQQDGEDDVVLADENNAAVASAASNMKSDGLAKLQQLLTLFIKSYLFSGGRCEELLLDAVPLLVGDITVDIREGSIQLTAIQRVVKHLLDLCYGMDDARVKSAEDLDGDADGDGDGDNGIEEENGPQVKKKRTTDGASSSVRRSGGGDVESFAEKHRVTSCVKQRLFLSLSRDILKLGTDNKAIVKEYVRLCAAVADGHWLNIQTVGILVRFVKNISLML